MDISTISMAMFNSYILVLTPKTQEGFVHIFAGDEPRRVTCQRHPGPGEARHTLHSDPLRAEFGLGQRQSDLRSVARAESWRNSVGWKKTMRGFGKADIFCLAEFYGL